MPSTTTPLPQTPATPAKPLLHYKVGMSPATTTSGRIEVEVSSSARPLVACDSIILDVPIGAREGDVFIRAPRIESWSKNWAVTSQESIATDLPAGVTKYHRFVLQNQMPGGEVPLNARFEFFIVGVVSTENQHTNRAHLVVRERAVPVTTEDLAASLEGVAYRTTTYPLAKYESFLLYLNSFYATDSDVSAVPKTEFANGDKPFLSWESNGHVFTLYQQGNPNWIYQGESSGFQLTQGLSATATFVLEADKGEGESKATTYAALTLTVANPSLTPKAIVGVVDNVGFGTSTPNSRLSLSPGAVEPKITLWDGGSKDNHYGFGISASQLNYHVYSKEDRHVFYAGGKNGTGTELLRIQGNGTVGIGTSAPSHTLDIQGKPRTGTHPAGRPLYATGDFDAAANGIEFRHSNGSQGVGFGYNSVYATGYNADQHLNLIPKGTGNVGIGTTNPGFKLDVVGTARAVTYTFPAPPGDPAPVITARPVPSDQGGSWERSELIIFHSNDTEDLITLRAPVIRLQTYNDASVNNIDNASGSKDRLYINANGYVGIGTSTPSVPLFVNIAQPNFSVQTHKYISRDEAAGRGAPAGDLSVSIYAVGEVIGSVIRAVSDVRLKTIVGTSDAATDLALLRQLRITDYTMRDQVQFGSQVFKKIIGQELEEVFPQAVQQQTAFLPDVYARASRVQRQGEALLVALPAGLPVAAAAGQRLKLIGPTGEVVATAAEAAEAGSRQLLLTGAAGLADTPDEVFVFGLEHADVRAVDYEAVAMLNVSATQALARQVDELHQQNAALREQCSHLDELRTSVHLLQQQVAALLSKA